MFLSCLVLGCSIISCKGLIFSEYFWVVAKLIKFFFPFIINLNGGSQNPIVPQLLQVNVQVLFVSLAGGDTIMHKVQQCDAGGSILYTLNFTDPNAMTRILL